MGVKDTDYGITDGDANEGTRSGTIPKTRGKAREHMNQLQELEEKDPEFYQFLKEHDKELLEFNDEDLDEDAETDTENAETDPEDAEMQEDDDVHDRELKEEKPSRNVITTAMVESWCNSIKENTKLSAVRSLMKAFRTACHYGDDTKDQSSPDFSIMSSSVFNKIMIFVLTEMDGVLRGLLKFPLLGGKKEMVKDLMSTRQWTNYNHLVKSYLSNSLHVLNQMTDTEMVSFTLRRIRYSSVFLAAFPSLLRKYTKVALHFWGTGEGALPVVSFLFIRDICIRLGSDCLNDCFRGIYKAYVLNCRFVNTPKLQHLQFLANCVIELFGLDLPSAYQHAFVFIRQLAMIFRETLSTKTKEAFRKVYQWKFMNCLELWTGAISAYGSEDDFRPLAYPLTQILFGVARLVPTARYFPLRLRCARMLNQIAASTNTFIPISLLLLEMLEMKELNGRPTQGVGNAVDFRTTLKVEKKALKTRMFQEACVFSVVEELAEHLAQWSYSVAFFELSIIPTMRLRSFCKSTRVERFRMEMKQLIHEIEANSEFINKKRMSISFLPNDPAASSFLEVEKKSGASPLSQYVVTLRQRAQQRNDSLMESSVIVGANSSSFRRRKSRENDEYDDDDEDDDDRNEQGAAVFSSSWLPGTDARIEDEKDEKRTKKKKGRREKKKVALDDDIVEDLVLSSDEDDSAEDNNDDGSMSDSPVPRKNVKANSGPSKERSKKRRKPSSDFSNNNKKNEQSQAKKSNNKKRIKGN